MTLRRPYGVTPFWFLNDRLDLPELLRQVAAMDECGVGGFVLHPRVGLPRGLGWMSQALLDFYEAVCEEARTRGLRVILYDEGMYPSGSASGQVVATNPNFACRGWVRRDTDHLLPDETRVGTYLTPDRQRQWVVDQAIPSVIRGLHYLAGDDGGLHSPPGDAEETPPAADLLNPDAMACFLRLTHDVFAARLGRFFGSTITGIFTDEPSLLGRLTPEAGGLAPILPGTTGMLNEAHRLTGVNFEPLLASLFEDDLPDTVRVRNQWARACRLRLEETYYEPMSRWCKAHGLDLMGHPEAPDDFAIQRHFSVPGQDLVWRWVLPGHTATRGRQSTQCKSAASAARRYGRSRCSNEFAGAYGHELTFAEFLWLTHHCLIRGVNWLIPHAYYYSLRGPRRDERPPDVGLNSAFASDLSRYNAYAESLCRLLTECPPVIRVGLLASGEHAPDFAADWLFRNQYDFDYVLDSDLSTTFAAQYDVIIFDGAGECPTDAPNVVRTDTPHWLDLVVRRARPTLRLEQPAPGLRTRRITTGSSESVLVFNEDLAPQVLDTRDFPRWYRPWDGAAGVLDRPLVVPAGDFILLHGPCNPGVWLPSARPESPT